MSECVAMKPTRFFLLATLFSTLVFTTSASAYVAPNLLFCKKPLTLHSGIVYVNGLAHSETGFIQANAGDEIAFDFTISNDNSPACQKPITAVLAFYGSSKDYPENWFSYEFNVETVKQLKPLPTSLTLTQNQLPNKYSFTILQGETIRAKLVVKTPANAKTTLLAFGLATAHLVPATTNETVLNTTSTLDFKPITLAGKQPSLLSTTSTTQATLAPTALAKQPELQPSLNWSSLAPILATLAILAILTALAVRRLAVRHLHAKKRVESPPKTMPRAFKREREAKRERKHAQAQKHETKTLKIL